jgi:hypothetical protein
MMEIRAIYLVINRGNQRVEVDTNSDIKRRIFEAWTTYNESDDAAVANAAYSVWCVLVEQLRELEVDDPAGH